MSDIFSEINKVTLLDYIESEQEENLLLDFKTVNTSNFKHKDDRKNLAKALSGFANSNGGLIVWGVDARKNKAGIDCASKISGVDNAKQFISRLNELTGMAVSPIVEGVQHRIIDMDDNINVVITHIPESDSGPHMSKLGEDRYYKRSGDSFYRMEHFDLEDMFGRRPKPQLNIFTRVAGSGLNSNVIVGLRNSGRASAQSPYFAFDCSKPFHRSIYGLDGNMNEGMKKLPSVNSKLPHKYGDGTNSIIHPGVVHEIALITLGMDPQKPTEDLIINYEYAAERIPLEKGKVVIKLQKLGIN